MTTAPQTHKTRSRYVACAVAVAIPLLFGAGIAPAYADEMDTPVQPNPVGSPGMPGLPGLPDVSVILVDPTGQPLAPPALAPPAVPPPACVLTPDPGTTLQDMIEAAERGDDFGACAALPH